MAAAAWCWPLQWHIIRWLVPAGFVAVLYVSPFSGKDGQAIGLRQVPGLKVLLIAFVCVSITVAVPMAYDEVGHNTTEIVLMMCMRLPLFMHHDRVRYPRYRFRSAFIANDPTAIGRSWR
ncbi:MAG: hypothetical protein IPP33_05835 [Flavobacteriales bacterium]|nr:hypothetical protein [Flavobacteriales bacterium]